MSKKVKLNQVNQAMNDKLLYFIEQSWLFVFIISAIFILVIIFRDIGMTTRRIQGWHRSSYYKTLPRVSLTFQHFSRRGELLSVTNLTLCQNVHGDLIKFLKLARGYNDKEIKSTLFSMPN